MRHDEGEQGQSGLHHAHEYGCRRGHGDVRARARDDGERLEEGLAAFLALVPPQVDDQDARLGLDGHVVDRAYDNDRQTQGIETFNDYIARDERVEQVILPLRDGLTLIRKK